MVCYNSYIDVAELKNYMDSLIKVLKDYGKTRDDCKQDSAKFKQD